MPILDTELGLDEQQTKQVWYDFKSRCWERSFVVCLRCKTRNVFEISKNKYRCGNKGCNYTFHDFSGRWVNKIKKLNLLQWGRLLRLFSDNAPLTALWVKRIVKISYPTAVKALTIIRQAIAQQSPDWEIVNSHIKSKSKEILVFGVAEKRNAVYTVALKDLTPKFILSSGMKIYQSNNIFFTERFDKYDYLLFYINKTHSVIPKNAIHSSKNIKKSKFREFLLEKLNKYFGVSNIKFPLYLKELEFKFNRKNPHEETNILAFSREGGHWPIRRKYLFSYITKLTS